MFRKATKQQSKLRMTIDGPAGSGKTFTALRFALALAKGAPVAVIDTEHGSASKYVGEAPDGAPWDFDVVELSNFAPSNYVEAILSAGASGYAALVIDSMSHAWEGKGGALDMKESAAAQMRTRNDYTAWRSVSPEHNRMVDTILQSPMHVITTMRSRMDYVQEKDENGRTTIRKIGMAPVQRPGMEYEFDVVADMDIDHTLRVSKTRCSAIDGTTAHKPGPGFLLPLVAWLESGSREALAQMEALAMRRTQAQTLKAQGASPKQIADELHVTIQEAIAIIAQPA
jgi:KaiC/GvpD/RAD55 family RecA-like ATPase